MVRAVEAEGLGPLAQTLKRRIRAAGPISVADYMAEVAAFYYAHRDPFGAAGDFVTAPEVSQIFGELIGLWCVAQWQRLGAPAPFLLVELGPGRGTLMADALRAARVVPEFVAALTLHLVEQSPLLRRHQAEKLAAFAPCWHDDVTTLPGGTMLLIANEFLDALPIRQFERRDGAWHERRIALDAAENLAFGLEQRPSLYAASLPPAAEGMIAELAPAALALAQDLGARLSRDGGAALFIDYGYFPSGLGDTLQAVRRHHAHRVLDQPGEADLTAHVDFARFAAAARAAGATSFGPVTQASFLERLGLALRRDALLTQATPDQAQAIGAACERLTGPAAMGHLFKVLALTQPGLSVPEGFTGATP